MLWQALPGWPARASVVALGGAALAALVVHLRRPPAAREFRMSGTPPHSAIDDRAAEISARFSQLLHDYLAQREKAERLAHELNTVVARRTAELVQANRRLEKLDRLKDEFVSLLAHELRTPLTSVRSYVELLDAYGDEIPVSERREFLDIIKTQVLRLNRLINELLDLSRLRSGKFTIELSKYHVGPMLEEVVESFRSVAERSHHSIELHEVDPELTMVGDRDRVVQILTNLVGNALKYSPEGSLVALDASLDTRQNILLAVSDNGHGIPLEERELVFEPFYRTRSVGQSSIEGTGLGLYLSRGLARQMEGDLSVTEAGSGGARFVLELPLELEPQEPTAAALDQDADAAEREAPEDAAAEEPVPDAMS